jgi:thymidylate kinase
MTIVQQIDAAVEDRILAFSPLPPEGRDVDLLVRPTEQTALAALLTREGFHERGWEWASFRACSAEAVDLVPAMSLGLPEKELASLFSEALPIEGMRNVARPAPHHFLLLLGRYTVEGNGALPEKRRVRIKHALAEDPKAWDAAAQRASSWSGHEALAALRIAYETGAPASRRGRVRANAERLRALGWRPHRAWARAWRDLLTQRRPPGRLISFSGLDGAGKTSQAEALKDSLEHLGFDVDIAWARLEWTTLWENRWLGLIAAPARGALRLLSWLTASLRSGRAPSRDEADNSRPPLEPARVRERSELISQVWVSIVAVAHGWAQRRTTRAHLRHGAVVISDRYTLDAAVQLRYHYGAERLFRFQTWLLRRLSPTPLVAYFVDVPPETAYRRKPEQYDLGALTRQALLYRELAERLGARLLDGERAREELCAEIAAEAWGMLHGS